MRQIFSIHMSSSLDNNNLHFPEACLPQMSKYFTNINSTQLKVMLLGYKKATLPSFLLVTNEKIKSLAHYWTPQTMLQQSSEESWGGLTTAVTTRLCPYQIGVMPTIVSTGKAGDVAGRWPDTGGGPNMKMPMNGMSGPRAKEVLSSTGWNWELNSS